MFSTQFSWIGWLTSRIWKICKHECVLVSFRMICRVAKSKQTAEMKRSRDSDSPRYFVCLLTRSHHRARSARSWSSESKSANICIRNPWFWDQILSTGSQTKLIFEKMFFFVLIMLIGYEVKWPLTGSYSHNNVFLDAYHFFFGFIFSKYVILLYLTGA